MTPTQSRTRVALARGSGRSARKAYDFYDLGYPVPLKKNHRKRKFWVNRPTLGTLFSDTKIDAGACNDLTLDACISSWKIFK